MGCSSCGGASAMAAPSLLASASSSGTTGSWKVTFPSGNSREFPTEWQAQASQAVGGGEVEYIAPKDPVASSSTTQDATSSTTTSSTTRTATRSATRKPAARKTAKRQAAQAGEAPIIEPTGNGDGDTGGGGGE